MDVEDYQNLLDKIQLLEELSTARKELDKGEGISQDDFFKELRAKYTSWNSLIANRFPSHPNHFPASIAVSARSATAVWVMLTFWLP